MENDNAELEALLAEAVEHCSHGDFDKAVTIHKGILTRYKDDDRACAYSYASIGDIYLTQRELKLAEDYLKKALNYEPLSPKYHYLLGFVYSVTCQWDRAVKEFELSVIQEPKEPEYLRGLGWALCSAGKKAKGLKHLGQAVSLAPDNVNILTDLAAAYLRDGHFDRARDYAERAVAADPKSRLARDVLNTTLNFREGVRTVRHILGTSQSTTYQMKVWLKGSRPAIWRRFRVSGDITLYKLHRILQVVMGWSGYHLYEFRVGRSRYGDLDPEYSPETKSARRVRVGKVFTREKSRFTYIYDFGDYWEHEIVLEGILSAEQELRYPVCVEGARACPPEDCGGIWGYSDLLKIIRNPRDEEYGHMTEWVGDEFDPEHFDLDKLNRRLSHIK